MSDQATMVEALLGVGPGLGDQRLALANSILDGLSVGALDKLAAAVAPGDARFKYRLIPKATLERRIRSANRLTVEEGDRLARLAKVYSASLEVYDDPVKAREFLRRPHMMLDEKSPLDVALATGPGADVVINLLGRITYGTAV